MPQNLYAETLLTPGLGVPMVWRFQNKARHIVDLLDSDSPVCSALSQAIDRYGDTFFEIAANKETLIEWANSQKTPAISMPHHSRDSRILDVIE